MLRRGSVVQPQQRDLPVTWSANAATQSLIFWCIITDNPDLLSYFWQKSTSPVMTALVIAALYRSLSKMKDCHQDTVRDFIAQAADYEERACKVFKIAHDINWRKAEETLTYQHHDYQNYSTMEMAGLSSSQTFLAHPGVWNKITDLWKKKQKHQYVPGLVTYCIDWASSVIFILLFALMLMDTCIRPSPLEYILFFWVCMLFAEEMRQVLEQGHYNFFYFIQFIFV